MEARVRRHAVFELIERARETHAARIRKHLVNKWNVRLLVPKNEVCRLNAEVVQIGCKIVSVKSTAYQVTRIYLYY
jgi:hypothetical protein